MTMVIKQIISAMHEAAVHSDVLPGNEDSPVAVMTAEGPVYATGVQIIFVIAGDDGLQIANKDDDGAFAVMTIA